MFFVFQKEARHQEVKDSESKEDERSRKQYPFQLHVLAVLFLVVNLCFLFMKSFHYVYIFSFFVSLFTELRELDQSRRHTFLAISVLVNCLLTFK